MRRLVLLALVTVGCGTWLGNPKDPNKPSPQPAGDSAVVLRFQGQVADGAALTQTRDVPVIGKSGAAIGVVTLTEARVVLREIRLKLSAVDEEDRQEFEGPFIVNLLAGSVSPDPGTISVPAGAYRHLKLKTHKLERDDAPDVVAEGDPIVKRSLHLTGTFKPTGGTPKPITVALTDGEEFLIGRGTTTGLDVQAGLTNQVIVAFQLDAWLNFSGRELDPGDSKVAAIAIDPETGDETGKKLAEAVKENVKSSAAFGKDDDRDGKLGEHERRD